MPLSNEEKLARLGMPTQLATEVADQIAAAVAPPPEGPGVFSTLQVDGASTLKSKTDVISGTNVTPRLQIAQWGSGTGKKSTGATVNDVNAYYAVLGGTEYYSTSNTGYQLIGVGYNSMNSGGASPIMPIGAIGVKQTSNAGDDLGSFVMAMRQTTSSPTIAEVLEFKLTGEIVSVLTTDVPVTSENSFTSKKYVDGVHATSVLLTGNQTIAGVKTFSSAPVVTTAAVGTSTTAAASTAFVLTNAGKSKAAIVALTAIADPATATAEACATAINAIIAALKA